MIYTKLAEIEGLVTAAGLDVDALSLIVSEAFGEDLGGRGVLPPGAGARLDVTSYATIPAGDNALALRRPQQTGHRRRPARSCLHRRGGLLGGPPDFELAVHATDGHRVAGGDVLITVAGNARALLAAERIALVFITMMSGVATATHAWVDALAGTNTEVCDSRKTIPGIANAAKVRGAHWRRYQSPDVIG